MCHVSSTDIVCSHKHKGLDMNVKQKRGVFMRTDLTLAFRDC